MNYLNYEHDEDCEDWDYDLRPLVELEYENDSDPVFDADGRPMDKPGHDDAERPLDEGEDDDSYPWAELQRDNPEDPSDNDDDDYEDYGYSDWDADHDADLNHWMSLRDAGEYEDDENPGMNQWGDEYTGPSLGDELLASAAHYDDYEIPHTFECELGGPPTWLEHVQRLIKDMPDAERERLWYWFQRIWSDKDGKYEPEGIWF